MKKKFVELVEMAYRFDLDDAQWLEHIAHRSAELTPSGIGAMVYTFDASDPDAGVEIGRYNSVGLPDEFVESMIALNRQTPDPEADVFFRSGVVTGTVSEMLERMGDRARGVYDEATQPMQFPDVWGLTASAPDHRGVVVNAPLASKQVLSKQQRIRWRQFGAHLQTAFRLRRQLGSLWSEKKMVLEPDGRVVDAGASADDVGVREKLERQVKAIERVRTTTGSREENPLDMWTALVDGRWSLVESFDTDGRRLYLAVPNNCETRKLFALTERERQIVAHVAQGDSNKWVAYQVGIVASTVAKLLGSALNKLGLRSRRELIFLYHRLESDGTTGPSEQ